MPFDGSGNYSRVHDWTDDRDAGIKIQAERMDQEFDDIANALNQVFFRSGLVAMSADLDMGGNDLIGLANGSAAAPSVQFQNDPNTGLYLIGTSALGATVNGSLVFRLDTAGAEVTGTLEVSGNTTVGGTLGVTGAATFSSTLAAGNTTITGTLSATGTISQNGTAVSLVGHTHVIGDITSLQTTLDAKANLSGADFTGVVSVSGASSTLFTLSRNTTGNVSTAFTDGTDTTYAGLMSGGGFGVGTANTLSTNGFLRVTSSSFIFTGSTMTVNGGTVWHSGNDGAGSGLDADTVDGVQASAFARLASSNAFTASNTYTPGSSSSTTIGGKTMYEDHSIEPTSGRTGVLVQGANNFLSPNDTAGFHYIWPFAVSGSSDDYHAIKVSKDATLTDTFSVTLGGDVYAAGDATIDGSLSVNGQDISGVALTTKNSNYTLATADSGTTLHHNNATAYSWTLPTTGTVPTGFTCRLSNYGSGDITINATTNSQNLRLLDGSGSTGNRTLSQYASAVLYYYGSGIWGIEGAVT